MTKPRGWRDAMRCLDEDACLLRVLRLGAPPKDPTGADLLGPPTSAGRSSSEGQAAA